MLYSKWGSLSFKYASSVNNKGIHWTSTNLIFSWETSLKRHFSPLALTNLPGLHCSANNHIYIEIYSLLSPISPQSSPEESSSVTWASSTTTKQNEALGFKEPFPGRLADTGPAAEIGQRKEEWERRELTLMTFSFPEGRICSGF